VAGQSCELWNFEWLFLLFPSITIFNIIKAGGCGESYQQSWPVSTILWQWLLWTRCDTKHTDFLQNGSTILSITWRKFCVPTSYRNWPLAISTSTTTSPCLHCNTSDRLREREREREDQYILQAQADILNWRWQRRGTEILKCHKKTRNYVAE
jgi:hypothetical protein